MDVDRNKITVLNIVGWGRSGSTILGNVLGEVENCFFGGEIRNIWNKVLIENRQCSCGKPIKDCSLWVKVFDNAFGGLNVVNPHEMRKCIRSYTRTRHIPLLFMPYAKEYFRKRLRLYIENLSKLYGGIQNVTGSKIIIDSSKSTSYSFVLSLLENIDLYIVHLIRDPRGVAFSRLKNKFHQNDSNGKSIEMKRISPISNSIMWDVRNIASEMLWKNYSRKYLRIRYEDFACKPKSIVKEILYFIGMKDLKLPFVSDNEVNLKTNHAVWGNPSRFKTGIVKLKLDEEWRTEMKGSDKLIATTLTLPLLKRYGY